MPARIMRQSVTVRVPATSANLGPGFDCLGLALAIAIEVGLTLEPQGRTRAHALAPMVAAAARAAYRGAGRPEPVELAVRWKGDLPIARGLGASAAARAAGLVGANALMGEPLDMDELLALGAGLEGHADNIAPALFGGLQVVVREGEEWRRAAVPLTLGLNIVLFVPDFEMPTREGRERLPKALRREDAVFNVGRAALLVSALSQGRWDLLDAATQDRVHQPARGETFSALYEIFDAATQAGAHAAYLSGAGSTVAAFTTSDEDRIAEAMRLAAGERGYRGRTLITEPSERGAELLIS